MPGEPRFALVGDCNAAMIGRVARAQGLRFVGGPLSNGAGLQADFFELRDGAFVPLVSTPAPEDFTELFRSRLPILSTVGSNIHRLALDLDADFYRRRKLGHEHLSDAVLRQVVADRWPGPLRFYRAAVAAGCAVHALHSTQRFVDDYEPLALRLEELFRGMLAEEGVALVDVRPETTDADGRLLPEYFTARPDDLTHANEEWAALVLERFLADAGVAERLPD